MFFTPELLAKRDSGFGLLWLAATLGSRSAFKKLPKRSVLTADITQLCDLISEPAEPLALRLSSNLMFGVVRVYKVKQEIFMTDVTNCVTSLKKVVQDLRASGAVDGQLQMANPVARAAALTIVPDPRAAYSLDYDAFVADWDEFLLGGDTARGSEPMIDDNDEDFDPTQKRKQKTKAVPKDVPQTEAPRKETHTLDEHHEHLLSASFDLSFHASANGPGGDPSSSQAEGAFGDFFPFSDGLDVGDGLGLGDDLARELGWAVSPVKSAARGSERNANARHSDLNFEAMDDLNVADMDFNFNADDMAMMVDDALQMPVDQPGGTPVPQQKSQILKTPRKENRMGPPSRMGSVFSQGRQPSPATSFSRQLLSQDLEPLQPLRDITAEHRNQENEAQQPKKVKRTRLLLDARTELTDDELKIARAKYLQSQKMQRRELLLKKLEKDSGRIIEEMIWGVPKGIEAQGLVNFWQENFKVQVEARSGVLRIHEEDDEVPRPKRRKTERHAAREHEAGDMPNDNQVYPEMEMGMGWDFDNNGDMGMQVDDAGGFRHSSEEPGQARRLSRSASVVGANLGFDPGDKKQASGSQRSSLFPWDNAGAGPSSSSGNAAFVAGSDHAIEPVDVRLRSSSLSRREGSLAPSQRGSMLGGMTFSPAPGGRNSQIFGEDFEFDVENPPAPEETQLETQKSEINPATLERNSYNFLEYAKMQYQTLPKPDGRLSFETVVPKETSTRHVAAAAFYHCLVLATKNHIRLEQPTPYTAVLIDIV